MIVRFLLVLSVTIVFNANLFCQGTVRGKVTDETGESVIGATVYLKSNPTKGVLTDFDGFYTIKVQDSLEQIMVVKFISYKTIEYNVQLRKGQVLLKDFNLKPNLVELKEFEISSEAVKNRDYYIENIKKKSSTTIDYISAETIKKTGDNNVTSAVSRVSGVSTNGSFITVRGIGDRYVKTNVNGLRIPTLDPFTNNIRLDMFPASLVDNIIITKTSSPDLPGDCAGAYISVETKDYPEKLSVQVESTVRYNPQTSFKDFVSTERSNTDFLGFDNGYRDHDHSTYASVLQNPSYYSEFNALGLGNYFRSIGVDGNTPWNDTYLKLGLIQLGLLSPGQMNDNIAFSKAKDTYATSFKLQAYDKINAAGAASGQSFPNNWDNKIRKAPLNFSQSFSIGNQTKLFGKTLGFMFGFRYSNIIQNDPSGRAERAAIDAFGRIAVSTMIDQHLSREINGWSALANVALKLNKNNSLSCMFMPNVNGVNSVRNDIQEDFGFTYKYIFTRSQFYESRRQLIYQLKTDHYIPFIKAKAEFNASYTDGKSDVPDFKSFDYYLTNLYNTYLIDRNISRTSRFYRYLDERLFDSRLSFEIPLSSNKIMPRKIKLGGSFQHLNRNNDQYRYTLLFSIPDAYQITPQTPLADFFKISDFGIVNHKITSAYQQDPNPGNHTIGRSMIAGGFVMADYSFTERLRLAGGARVESSDFYTDVFKYDSLGYAAGDPRRFFPGGDVPIAPQPGILKKTNILPSLNFVYKLQNHETAPTNLRLNYSQSLARPSLRELSEVVVPDFELRAFVFGNSSLKQVQINNYDLRLEKYFSSGDNLSLSVFYKQFKNHIELVNSNIGYSWQNVDKSFVQGIEIEGKKMLGKHFEFRSNISLIKSLSDFVVNRLELNNGIKKYIPFDTVSRPMFGQAPFVINGILSYNADSLGLVATISYNVQGPRLAITSTDGTPDIYELPRHMLDLKISKTLGKHFSVSLNIRDLLNAPVRRSYNFQDGWKIDYDRFRFGTNYLFSVLYRI